MDDVEQEIDYFFNNIRITPGQLENFLYQGSYNNEVAHNRALAVFKKFGILPRRGLTLNSPRCGNLLRSRNDPSRQLGWRYVCSNNHKLEPSTNTFFYNVHLKEMGANAILCLMLSFLEKIPVIQATRWSALSEDSAVNWYKFFRNVAKKVAWHEFQQIGGRDDIVEIDEMQLFKRKHNQGRRKMLMGESWVFGGISRATKKVFLKAVSQRTTENLLPILQDCVDSNSFVCSKVWGTYDTCSEISTSNRTVNHTENSLETSRQFWAPPGRFQNACLDHKWQRQPPQPGLQPYRVHTQNIENIWKKLKKLMLRSTNKEFLLEYLGEFMYRQNVLLGLQPTGYLQRFLLDIQRAYPGIGKEPMADEYDDCHCHICEPQ